MSVVQIKNSESSWGIEPQTLGSRAPMLYHRATETLLVSEVYYEVHMVIRVLHNARISNVYSVMFINRIRKMVSLVKYS